MLSLSRNSLQAVKDMVYASHQLLWLGWVWAAACLLELVVYYFIWKILLGPLIFKVVSGIPSVSSNKGTIVLVSLALGAYLLLLLWTWTASFIYLRIDKVFYSLKTSPLLAKLGAMIAATTQILIYGLGFAVIWRVLDWFAGDRLVGHMGFTTDGSIFHDPGLWLAVVLAIIFIPLSIRLWYLPVITALETDPVIGSWKLLLRATKGHTRSLFLATLPQWGLLVLCYLAYRHIAADLLDPVINTAAHARDYADLSSLSKALEGNISIDLFGALMVFALVIGPIISLMAAMQLSVVRGLIGAPLGGETTEQDYAVADYDTQKQELPLPEIEATPLPAYSGVVMEDTEADTGLGEAQGEFSEEVRAAASEEVAGLHRSAAEGPEFPPLSDAGPASFAAPPTADRVDLTSSPDGGEAARQTVQTMPSKENDVSLPSFEPTTSSAEAGPPDFGPPPTEDAVPVMAAPPAEHLNTPPPADVNPLEQSAAEPPASVPGDAPPADADPVPVPAPELGSSADSVPSASEQQEAAGSSEEDSGRPRILPGSGRPYDPLIDDIPDTPLPARLKRSDD